MTDAAIPDRTAIAAGLRAAMRRMPGPVALVTTHDPEADAPAGLAASSVIPVSMDPPSMLVAINRSASAHAAIERAGRFCINLLGTTQTGFVGLFSDGRLRAQRFMSDEWAFADGLPYLRGACASILCTVSATTVVGTHELFVGAVFEVRTEADACTLDPLGWMEGGFAAFGPLS